MANNRLVIIGATLINRPLAKPLNHHVRIGDELNNGIQGSVMACKELIKVSNLVGCSRVPIEEEPSATVGIVQPVSD
jgi:hypothetical protein